MKYFESMDFTKSLREEYLRSILSFANGNYPKLDSGDEYINELGYPLTLNKHENILSERVLLSNEEGYSIYRYTFTILGIIRLSGLLFEIDETSPLVIYQHGFLGTPEVISSVYKDRNTSNYNDITMRLLAQKVNVFCPQLLMWSVEKYGVDYSRPEIDKKLRENGSSLISLETYCLKEIIHFFKQQSYAYINMFGMSYGAYYTYHVALVCDEVKTYWACSYLITNCEFEEMGFNTKLETVIKRVFTNNDVYITVGDHDPIIVWEETNKLLNSLPHQEKITIFSGEHEIYKSDEFIKSII